MTTRRNLFALTGAGLAATALGASAQETAPAAPAGVRITQIRNATLHVDYGGTRFLVDPMLADRHAFPGFEGTVNSEERNALVHLPLTMDEILDVDAVIVTHLHEDHWDEAARNLVPKAIPLFAQNEADAETIRGQGFTDVRVLSEDSSFNGIRLVKTDGRHGTEAAYAVAGDLLGQVCGVVFIRPDEKTVYLAGDTIWNDDVAGALAAHKPEIAILNTGDARIIGVDDGIIMGKADVLSVHEAAPDMILIASHMEAINHCTLTRADLRAFARENGFLERLLTPGDGETVTL
ncbi:MBL fold metallo-hydrolase [Paracoccus aminovorans]|uniref:MBL fold metallo-hydrolase n=1 Tax=Paracoccus aminovorans TaxID=34004 RepID=UPI002B260A3C|nr:MBL fold metallo-hydrolase [Paracoccus aminovorans]